MCYELAISWTHESPFTENRRTLSILDNWTAPRRCDHLKLTLVILSRQGVYSWVTWPSQWPQVNHRIFPGLSSFSWKMTRSFYSERGWIIHGNLSQVLLVVLVSIWRWLHYSQDCLKINEFILVLRLLSALGYGPEEVTSFIHSFNLLRLSKYCCGCQPLRGNPMIPASWYACHV